MPRDSTVSIFPPRVVRALLIAALITTATAALPGCAAVWQPAAVAAGLLLVMLTRAVPSLRSLTFTAWIIAALTAAMIYPAALSRPFDLDLKNQWAILLMMQAVMFGMGTQMSLADFKGVAKMPWPVLIGFIGQFSIMPLTGWTLTKVFTFEPEIAAGIILIGCCPSGLASNVMSYIARANLPLAVTITACTTVAAPLMTPLLMKLLAGTLIKDLSFVSMMLTTVKLMIVPLLAALLHDWLKTAPRGARRAAFGTAAGCAAVLAALACGGWAWLEASLSKEAAAWAGLPGFFCAAVAVGCLWHLAAEKFPRLSEKIPLLSMAGILYVTVVTVAAGRDHLLKVGPLLLVAAALHNLAGYFFGYWLSRAARLDLQSSRTVSFEVGLQNGGTGTMLAAAAGKLDTMGLASAIFSPWMNISGSLLAHWWRRRPVAPASGSAE
jgi:bile acid:Na+ symporter, BASS family